MKLVGAVLLAALLILSTTQAAEISLPEATALRGRYQVIASAPFLALLDTTTGRVWMMFEDTECRGRSRCFFELDRLRLIGQDWKSEIYPPRSK